MLGGRSEFGSVVGFPQRWIIDIRQSGGKRVESIRDAGRFVTRFDKDHAGRIDHE